VGRAITAGVGVGVVIVQDNRETGNAPPPLPEGCACGFRGPRMAPTRIQPGLSPATQSIAASARPASWTD
jgi:hypothetical protein